LYNPVTQQVAISGVPDTTSYGDGESLEVPPYGMLACLGSELELHSGRVLPEMRGSARSTSLALAAHAA
jgi:hypothetical protein